MKLSHNISRIEAFSGGVFAFAATLLVVSLGTDSSDSIIGLDLKSFASFAFSVLCCTQLFILQKL